MIVLFLFFDVLDDEENEKTIISHNNKLKNQIDKDKNTLTTTITNSEEDETKLIQEEQLLMEELKQMQEKHKNVKLVYEKVIGNIKSLCKIDQTKDITINLTQSQILNLNDSKLDTNTNQTVHQTLLTEDDIYKSYCEFLHSSKNTIDMLFLNHTKEEFLSIMKEKGLELNQNQRKVKSKKILTGNRTNSPDKLSVKEFINKPFNANEEYEYSDEELKKEDILIKEEKDEIVKHFKAIVIKTISNFIGKN